LLYEIPGTAGVNGMATISAETRDKPKQETVEQHFRQLEAEWMTSVGHHSSTTKLVSHPAFQEIIRMGTAVVPFLLRDLEQKPRLWVWALPEITGADPVPAPDQGNIAKMSEAWLRWARVNGYQW
jgi:hypothetical protein